MNIRLGVVAAVVVALGGCGTPMTGSPATSAPITVAATGDGIPAYNRAAFGGWARVHGQCDTREVVLERDSAERAVDTDHDGCADDGMLVDVYSGNLIRAQDAQIDHVFPTAVAWREGAYKWTATERRLFYNDQSNLRAVLGRDNERKGDLTPAQMLAPPAPGKPPAWKPASPAGRCALATIWRATAVRWQLPIPPDDDAALRTMTADCGR